MWRLIQEISAWFVFCAICTGVLAFAIVGYAPSLELAISGLKAFSPFLLLWLVGPFVFISDYRIRRKYSKES